jgi:4-amino-4-deoxy-L-arabinose transferase-like glycosyltransferase
LACVGSRLATTITYIEDPDSLRFALSVADAYDIAALQPHFPGYPVFWAAAELVYLPIGSFSASFSIVGGLATLGIVWALLRLRGVALRSVEGAAIAGAVFFCPLLWLMGTRYMPDLLGTANALAALALLVHALFSDGEGMDERAALAGIVLTGLLAGLRLSYLPLVIVPALWVLGRSQRPGRLVGAGAASVAVWLVPMILDTGFWTLVDVAWGQTTGHFTEFGGTVRTESDLSRRVAGLVQGLWADGFGAWWPGRHPLTAVVGVGTLSLGGFGTWRLARNGRWRERRFWLVGFCALLYGVWIFVGQNVVHKSRHVLPLLPLLLTLPAVGAATLWGSRRGWGRAAVLGVAGAYAAVTLVLADQHRDPSAIAQAKTFVERQAERPGPTRVLSKPLVNTYLRRQRVKAQFLSVDDSSDVRRARRTETGRTIVVGTYAALPDREPTRTKRFYHNPHVNRMWPKVTVSVYEH